MTALVGRKVIEMIEVFFMQDGIQESGVFKLGLSGIVALATNPAVKVIKNAVTGELIYSSTANKINYEAI